MSFDLLAAAAHGEGTPAWAMLAYLAAGVFFILALRGLSSPASSRAGNRNGMIGMAIALVTTLVTHDIANIVEIGLAIFLGGIIRVDRLRGTNSCSTRSSQLSTKSVCKPTRFANGHVLWARAAPAVAPRSCRRRA